MNISIGPFEPSLGSRLTRTWFGMYTDTKAPDDCIVSPTSIDTSWRKSPNLRFDSSIPVVFDHCLHFSMVYFRTVTSQLVGHSSIKSRMLKVSALDRLAPHDPLLQVALVKKSIFNIFVRALSYYPIVEVKSYPKFDLYPRTGRISLTSIREIIGFRRIDENIDERQRRAVAWGISVRVLLFVLYANINTFVRLKKILHTHYRNSPRFRIDNHFYQTFLHTVKWCIVSG